MELREFSEFIVQKGHELYRDMPWRQDVRPYYILVSELMLQQTQVERVIPKFNEFIGAFPNEQALAAADLASVITLWQGLGYNRRARFLHNAAKQVVASGGFARTHAGLIALPGVGKNTAGALLAYAYNKPAIFIETNIRTVYFHHFFTNGQLVSDTQICELLEQTINREHPREFYWALMDYGSWLKKQGAGRIQQSKHYKKQPPLKGSIREMRGRIIMLLTGRDYTETELRAIAGVDERFAPALAGLANDGLVVVAPDGQVYLTK